MPGFTSSKDRLCLDFFLGNPRGSKHKNAFTRVFGQRLIDCFSQNWHEHEHKSSRFDVFRMFDISIILEFYFKLVTNEHIRDALIGFRIGTSEIRTP